MKDRYFPIAWTDEEHTFAKAVQKEMKQPEVGMSAQIGPYPRNVEIGGSSDVGTISRMVPTM